MTSKQEETTTATRQDDDLESIPLFATQAPSRGEMNERFQALSCVMEESTPDELALGLREQGNASFRRAGGVGVRDAVDCYTRSLAVRGADARVHAVTRLNRAAAHLRLGNYGSALADCDAALAVDPRLRTAHYRAADALRHLGRFSAAIQHCDAALKDLKCGSATIAATAAATAASGDDSSKDKDKKEEDKKEEDKEDKEDKDKTKEEEEEEERKRDMELFQKLKSEIEEEEKASEKAAAAREADGGCRYAEIERDAAAELARRGVAVGEALVDTAQLAAQANGALVTRLVDVVDDAGRTVARALAMPVVLLYEEVGVVDCVAAFPETRPLAQLLAEVLAHPPAWDTHRHYRRHTVEMYVELRRAPRPRLARLKPTSTLAALLAHPQYVLPRMPVISVVSTASKAFRKAFLAKYA